MIVSAYCKAWEEFINSGMVVLLKSKEIVQDYKAKLAAEEQLSRKTTRRK